MPQTINHTALAIQHSLVIGCGGRGTEVVAQCRDSVLNQVFDKDGKKLNECSALQFLVFDSARQNLESNNRDHGIQTIPIACNELGDIIASRDGTYPDNPNGVIHIKKQMPYRNYARMIRGLPSAYMGNSTCPPLGAMNFAGSWTRIENQLKQILEKWMQQCPSSSGYVVRPFSEWNQVFIAAGLYGGTGCGIHLHVAAMVRNLLKKMEVQNCAVYAFFLLPDLVANPDETGKKKLRANSYAALKEIDHFASGNPFVIKTGDNIEDIIISNQKENDVLFNKIFLVNDENLEGVVLDLHEAEVMTGELLFHLSATDLGPSINARLTDSPHEYTTMDAPDFAAQSDAAAVAERRGRAYSTFGMATTRIPYAILKNNLITDFAIEILNECIMLPDDDSKPELEKLQKTKKWFHSKYIDVPEPLSHIELDNLKIEMLAARHLPLPDFLRRKGGRSFAEYMKKSGMNFEDTVSRLSSESFRCMSAWEEKRDHLSELTTQYDRIVDDFQERMSNEGAGPRQVAKILKEIFKYVKAKQDDLIQQNRQNSTHDILKAFIQDRSEKLSRLQDSKNLPFLKDKRLREAETLYKGFVTKIRAYRDLIHQELTIALLEQVKIRLDLKIEETKEDEGRYQLILDHLNHNDRPYESSHLVLNAVPLDLLKRFIQQFPFQAGNRPEDLAERIKQNGLQLADSEVVQLSDFPDHYPEKIANALLNLARETIQQTTGEDTWQKSFSQSGMFPRPGVDLDWQTRGIDINAYGKTMAELVRHSAPYLEYSSLKGFDVCRENFFIHPKNTAAVNERAIWKKQGLPMGRPWWMPSESASGAYSLTCLQFHFGIPLYSLDKFQEWKDAYEYMLRCTDRPLHKFDDTYMLEPYIDISRSFMEKDIIESLFDWAMDISKTAYVIFLFCGEKNVPVLNMLENPYVRSYYFTTHKRRFVSRSVFEDILFTNANLNDAVLMKVQLMDNLLNKDAIGAYLSVRDAESKVRLVVDKLIEFSKQPLKENELNFYEIISGDDGTPQFWLNASGYEKNIADRVLRHFYEEMKTPELNIEGMTPQTVLTSLLQDESFQKLFWAKCREAHENLVKMGYSDRSHEILKDVT
ncbi:MAG: tubulin-like doman-containing protein [Desulfotignum sp.]|nr:tubulin-like doman-containing protein [Desulfotignum sp.]